MELDGTKDSAFQGTKEIHERSQMKSHLKKAECDNTASSTSDESYPTFEFLYENIYLGNKKKRVNKEIRRMSCDCPFNPEEHDFVGCGEDCLNRLLMIECNSRCPCGEFCSNRKFQKGQKVKVEAFKTLKKGWGLRTSEDISANQFVMEYCGEVMGYEEFEKRVETYDKENRRHYYFMTLRADEIIDATHKGNLSRFINHSCNPNCETQKWTVNGYLRIGFFSMEDIKAGTELTFDYKFQRYGKKAQACYCDSLNCRGIIGGEKHTPLKSIISGRAASPVSTSSPRRSQRRSLAEQFDDKPLEIEIAQLLGGETGIKSDEQALKLSQFMVRAETPSQRLLLLDTLLATEDQNCLRSFVRYQGLSLLWSWMVDLRENSQRVPKKIVQVLKHLPVANLNQVQDSKVLKVVCKWARKPSVTIAPEEETSSSDLDSRGFSPLELMDDIVKRQGKISASCAGTAADDFQYMSESKNLDTHSAVNESIGVPGTKIVGTLEKDARTLNEEQEREYEKVEESEAEKPDEFKDNVNDFEGCELKTASITQGENLSGLVDDTPRTEDSSSEESRWSEDDSASTDSENIRDLATDLLESWSNLKEVYRIPKKSTNVEKREPESTSSTSGSVEAVVTEPSNLRRVVKIPPIPTIEGDLFQKDEFLSKLGERKLVEQKPGELESTENSTEIPALMGSALTKSDSEDNTRDTGKLPIHQRLQMVACGGGNPPKQYPVWHGKGNRKARKHPYHAGGGSFQPGIEKWGARHQATSKSRFNSPTNHPSNQPMHPGVCGPPRPNVPGNQWQEQNAPPYPGPYQFPPGSGPRSSTPMGYPTPNPNHPTAPPQPMQSSYFVPGAQHNQTGSDTRFQGPYPTQASHGLRPASAPPNPSEQSSFGPGLNPLPGQPGIQTNPRGYQQIQQPINPTLFPLPPFDPSQPPPNFVPSKSNVSSQQFPNAAQPQFGNTSSHTQFSNASSQFSSTPPSYSTPPSVPNVPSYPLQPPQAKQQVVSQRSPPPDLEQSQAVGTQLPSNAVSTTSLVNSTVNENARETLNRSTTDISSNSDRWSADPLSKPRDVSLPPGWKMAYDGEGRAYYYHVVTRQTQWELPTTDRSPPTPELGYLGDELDASVEMTTTFHSQNDVVMEEVGTTKRKKPKTPSTPPGSPPTSPVGKYTTAAADSTDVRKGLYSPSVLLQARHLTPEQRKLRETFRMKLSAVVVNYLNPYHKLDCKIGRITTVDDFKFLARKLTHGVMVKELSRLKDENELACNDSVKIKTKEYIRQYMQKFGPVYKPS